MDNVSTIVSELENKVKKIVNLQSENLKEKQNLKKEIDDLNNIIEEQKVIIRNLEEKVKVQRIIKTLKDGKDIYQTKLKVNELVREIDKCIALLNK